MRLLLALPLLSLALASPVQRRDEPQPSDTTPVPVSDVTPFQDPARWAQGAYCEPAVGSTVNEAEVLWTGGDGRAVPFAYVAYSQSKNTIVVAHQGTNTSSLASIEDDLKADAVGPDSTLASCVPAGSLLHSGFQSAWQQTGSAILQQVSTALQTFPGASVTITGHSLGAAIAGIDSAYFACNGIAATTIVFGMPRSGNPTYSGSLNLQHLVNYRDPVPHLPPHGDDYWHAAGELWQTRGNDASSLVDCVTTENKQCSWSVPFYDYETSDHSGMYAGVSVGSGNCA